MNKRYAVGLFISAFVSLFIAIVMSGASGTIADEGVDHKRSEKSTATKATKKSVDMTAISRLNLNAPHDQHSSYYFGITFADVTDMTIQHRVKADNGFDLDDFDLDNIEIKTENDTVSVTVRGHDKTKRYDIERLTLVLPHRDWHIDVTDENNNIDEVAIKNENDPVSLTISSNDLRLDGNFNNLEVWHTSDEDINVFNATAQKLSVYSTSLMLHLYNSSINTLELHAPKEGVLETNSFSALQNVSWQPLSNAEEETLEKLRPIADDN